MPSTQLRACAKRLYRGPVCGALGRQGALSEEHFHSLYVRGLLTGHVEDALKVWDSVDKPRPRCACKSGELCMSACRSVLNQGACPWKWALNLYRDVEGQLLNWPASCMLCPLTARQLGQPKPYPVPLAHIHIRGCWEAPASGPLLDGCHPRFYGHILCSPGRLGGWHYLFGFI